MSQSEYRLLRITIQLKKLILGVKFPCSISFQLKNQNNYIETRHNYQLRNSQCSPTDKLSLDLQVLCEGDRYVDKNILLVVFMTSANGKIPAGSAYVHVTELGMLAEKGEQSLSLSKCPDKSAKIIFNKKVQFVRALRKVETSARNQKVKNLLIKSRNLRANTSGQKKDTSRGYKKSMEKEEIQKIVSGRNRKNAREKWGSGKNYMAESYDNLGKSEASQIESRLIYTLEDQNFSSRDQEKLYTLEKERAQYLKQISKLKGQLNLIKRNEYHDSEEQIAKYTSEIDRLADELEKLKDRYKNLERREKQTNLSNRDLKDEIEKLKNRISQHELINMENEFILEERQKSNKTLTSELKEVKEQLQDLKINKSAQDKKYEFKEVSFKEQFQKLNQKYQQSETERQKNLYDLNNKLAEMGQLEKKNQLQLKQKERFFLDEKNVLMKKIQALSKNIEKLSEEKEEEVHQNKQLSFNNSILNKKYDEKVGELAETKGQKEMLEIEFKKLENIIEKQEKEIEELKLIMEERNKLKKNYNDRSVENERHKELSERFSKTSKNLQKKVKDLQSTIAETTKEKNALNTKVLGLSKELENSRKAGESKDRQIQSLNQILQSSTIKINEMKAKSQNDYMRSEESRRSLEEELTYTLKSRQHLQGEYEEIKWRLTKTKENAESLHDKLTHSNEEILKFNQQLLTYQEKNKKLIEEIKENENSISLLKSEKEGLEQKEKQYLETLKGRNENIYELSKSLQQKEQENYILGEKSKQKEIFYSEKNKRDEEIIKNKNLLIKELNEKISKMEIEITEKSDKIKSYQNDLQIKNQQIVYHKEMGEKIKEDERTEEKLKSNYYNELIETKKSLSEANAKNEKQQELNKKLQIQLNSFKGQFEKYREENIKAFEQFLIQMGKEEINSQNNYTLYAFPELQISNMQIQAFKKRNSQLIKHKQAIKQLEDSKNLLQVQFNKTKKYFGDQEAELQESLNNYKQKSKNLQKDILSERQKLYDSIRVLEEKVNDLIHENERLSNDVKNDKNYIEELQKQIEKLYNENSGYQTELSSCHKKITEMKISGSQSVTAKESEFSSMIGQSKTSAEKYKSLAQSLEKKLMNMDSIVNEKEQVIKKSQRDISSLTQEKMKLQQAVEFNKKKNIELNNQNAKLENDIKSLQRKLKDKSKIEEDLNAEITGEKFKYEEMKLKLSKSNETLGELEKKIESLNREVESTHSHSTQIVEEARKAEKSYKDLLQKANEQVIKLKEKQILLNSEIQLKDFLVQQHEGTIKNLKEIENDLQNDLSDKKADLIKFDNKVSELESQIMFIHENHALMTNEKETVEKEYIKQKSKLEDSTKQLVEYSIALDNLANKEKQIYKLREDLQASETQSGLLIKDLRSTLSQLKKEISQRNVKEEELRRKIREQEKIIEKKNYDILTTKKKYKGEAERQKIQIIHDLEEIERENAYLQKEFQLQQEHYTREIEALTNKEMNLNSELASKEQIIKNKDRQIKEYENKMKKLTKNYLNSDFQDGNKAKESRFQAKSYYSNDSQGKVMGYSRKEISEENY